MSERRWQDDAACLGMDPDLFFPEQGDDQGPAKAICAICPVREPCLEKALTPPFELFGIWGGSSERERRRMRLLRSQGPEGLAEWEAKRKQWDANAAMRYREKELVRERLRQSARDKRNGRGDPERAGRMAAMSLADGDAAAAGVLGVLEVLSTEGAGSNSQSRDSGYIAPGHDTYARDWREAHER